MTDSEVEIEVQQVNFADRGPSVNSVLDGRIEEKFDPTESPLRFQHREHEESLLLLADIALAPPCGRDVSCGCLEVRQMGMGLQCIQLQLQAFLKKVDHLRDCLISRKSHLDKEALAAAVSTLLYTCQPYFKRLESAARGSTSQQTHLSVDICSTLLDFSQQLCDCLEQLVLTYAGHDLLCLDETEPNSVSNFCIGQCQFGGLRLTIFRYFKPTPYLARVDTGLYKRMRWNVERVAEEQDQSGEERRDEAVQHTDYYFLCCEDIPNKGTEGLMRMWSIGQWVQVEPDPKADDLYSWILCEVPRGNYQELLALGHNEPSSCNATDFLQQLLLQRCRE